MPIPNALLDPDHGSWWGILGASLTLRGHLPFLGKCPLLSHF